jgi:hypothetical protein
MNTTKKNWTKPVMKTLTIEKVSIDFGADMIDPS